MNDKLKRAVAIIALVLVLVFTVSFILYLFDKTMLNGAIGELALWSGAFGGLLALVLWLSHSFPAQQRKDEERDKLYKEAEALEDEAEALEDEATQKDKTSDETPSAEVSDGVSSAETSDDNTSLGEAPHEGKNTSDKSL